MGELQREWHPVCSLRRAEVERYRTQVLSQFYAQPSTAERVLRLGIISDSDQAPRFYAEVLKSVLGSHRATIELVVKLDGGPRPAGGGLLFERYRRWDDARIRREDDPFAPCDLSPLLNKAARVTARAEPGGTLDGASASMIRGYQLDVLLLLSPCELTGEAADLARHGLWQYQFGDGDTYSGAPAHLWEVIDRHPLSGVTLCRLSGEAGRRKVLERALFDSRSGDNISWARNRERPAWAATWFVTRQMHRIAEGENGAAPRTEQAPAGRGMPGNLRTAAWLGGKLVSSVRRRFEPKRMDHWKMALRTGGGPLLREPEGPNFQGFRWIDSPPGHFYADPFLCQRDGRTWLFYEHYRYPLEIADLDVAEVLPDGSLGESHRVLRRPYHLSFPQVFEHDGEMYMLPETGGNRTVELYRATRFPYEWTLDRVLLEGHHAVDTAVWKGEDRWWFFSTLKDPRGGCGFLVLFSASHLHGEWSYHPANPICSDVRAARGAGAIFRQDGRLLRPSQDCSVRYGYRLNFHEITRLNPKEYEERTLRTIHPEELGGGFNGIHTYNRVGSFEVIDGCLPESSSVAVPAGGDSDARSRDTEWSR